MRRQIGQRVSESLKKQEKRPQSHMANAFRTYALGYAACDVMCYGADSLQLSKKPNKTQTQLTSKTLWLSQSRVSNGVAILDGNATKTVSGFTIDVGFTFAGHETEAASTTIWMPHSDCPMGLSAKVVSNVSTPFLIGLDVIRECGVVIDCHDNCADNHIMKRHLPCGRAPRYAKSAFLQRDVR